MYPQMNGGAFVGNTMAHPQMMNAPFPQGSMLNVQQPPFRATMANLPQMQVPSGFAPHPQFVPSMATPVAPQMSQPATVLMTAPAGSAQPHSLLRVQPVTSDLTKPESASYYKEIMEMFQSEEFKRTHDDPQARKDVIGNHIYEHIEKISCSAFAPKITGMIIDLPFVDLIPVVSSLENLTEKIRHAEAILREAPTEQSQVPSSNGAVVAGAK